MNAIMSQGWTNTLEDAFCEFDRKKLIERIGLAQAAIDGRLGDFQNDSSHHEERRLIAHALRTLRLLRSSTSEASVSREKEDKTAEGYPE